MAAKPDELHAAVESRNAILARMDSAADSFAQGITTARQMARINEQLKTQLEAAELAVLRCQPLSILDGMTGSGSVAAWAATSIERKRQIIRALVTVTILPSGPGIKFSADQVRFTPRGEQ
ncbi:hypothetical protein [Arthrobacter sp. PAMC25284]|uniref:hypothetical protein n=1 Tax=Arthrobacter sp. PAMC25284 TaxID=2861279 RepID=UPI001C6380C6|nr:hypothetical protein [Arthrobacter sp. PAMC25284]QYF89703.1 hypothetical protein KY499_17030 [Arthrobacter sp. PAMC25284]